MQALYGPTPVNSPPAELLARIADLESQLAAAHADLAKQKAEAVTERATWEEIVRDTRQRAMNMMRE
ncbi:hypothetical protein HWV62_27973 [Athelia sp. TMB]|nr:hypothetical protein HWV62_27973 [Athelia sp. TMB]